MGFYWSYTLLLQSPVLMRSWGILGILSVDAVWGIGEMLRLGLGPGNGLPYMMSCKLTRHLVSLGFCYKWCTICSCMQSRWEVFHLVPTMALSQPNLAVTMCTAPCTATVHHFSCPDDVILMSDIDNAGQESTTNDVRHIHRQIDRKNGKDSIPWL